MNKQEIIENLELLKFEPENVLSSWGDGYNRAIEHCIITVKNINEINLDSIKESDIFITQHNNSTPPHYQGTIQPIDLINAKNLNFNLGNVVKYVCRAGKKDGETIIKDLNKAIDYINFEIERLNNERVKNKPIS